MGQFELENDIEQQCASLTSSIARLERWMTRRNTSHTKTVSPDEYALVQEALPLQIQTPFLIFHARFLVDVYRDTWHRAAYVE